MECDSVEYLDIEFFEPEEVRMVCNAGEYREIKFLEPNGATEVAAPAGTDLQSNSIVAFLR